MTHAQRPLGVRRDGLELRPHNARRAARLLQVAAAVALLAGCRHDAPTSGEQTDAAPKAAQSTVERGPVRLTVTVEPAPARLSDDLTLTLEVEHELEVAVKKPEFGTELGDLVIRDFREPLPRVQDQRQVVQQVYTLEPTRAGTVVIDPIAVTFTDNRPEGEGKSHTLQTEPITVEISAAGADDAPSLAGLRGPAEPLPLAEPPGGAWWWLAALAGAVLLGGGAFWWLRRRQRGAQAAVILTPAELAYWELQQLLGNQQARDDVKLFYVELTAIVRRYIERAKGIRAPEQTTQEFLHEISRRNDFPPDEAGRLQSFLEAADLVKFAAHQPRAADVEESFRRAKVFVGCDGSAGVAA